MARAEAGAQGRRLLPVLAMLILIWSTHVRAASKNNTPQRKIIIHVPYYVKNHHHTHTVYKYIKEQGQGQDDNEELGDQRQQQAEPDDHIGEIQQDAQLEQEQDAYGGYGPQAQAPQDTYDQDVRGDHGHAHYHTTFLVRHNEGQLFQGEDSHESLEVIGDEEQPEQQQQHGFTPEPGRDDYPDYGDDEHDNHLRQETEQEDQEDEGEEEEPAVEEDQGRGLRYAPQQHGWRRPDRHRHRGKRGHKRRAVRRPVPVPVQMPVHLAEELRPPTPPPMSIPMPAPQPQRARKRWRPRRGTRPRARRVEH